MKTGCEGKDSVRGLSKQQYKFLDLKLNLKTYGIIMKNSD